MKLIDTHAAIRVGTVHALGNGGIRATIDSFQLGYTLDDIAEYVPDTALELIRGARDHKTAKARLTGLVAAAMCLAAEIERDRQ